MVQVFFSETMEDCGSVAFSHQGPFPLMSQGRILEPSRQSPEEELAVLSGDEGVPGPGPQQRLPVLLGQAAGAEPELLEVRGQDVQGAAIKRPLDATT